MRIADRIAKGRAGRIAVCGAMAVWICSSAVAAARPPQSPFADVPRGDWAYKALQQLMAAHIVQPPYDAHWVMQGKRRLYPLLTRYEFAVATQRALAKVNADRKRSQGRLTASQRTFQKTVERLATEFQPELASLEKP